MTTWMSDELNKIGTADELEIQSRRPDGTLRNPVIIWVVREGDELYVRAYKGRTSPWFRGALGLHEGHVRAGGVDKDVSFEEVGEDAALNDRIDAVFRSKYRHYAKNIVDTDVTPGAHAATLRLVPR